MRTPNQREAGERKKKVRNSFSRAETDFALSWKEGERKKSFFWGLVGFHTLQRESENRTLTTSKWILGGSGADV